MKVLIVGKGSYIGGHIKTWLEKNKDYTVEEISIRTGTYKEFDFSLYDCVIHVAAIVHKSKESIPWETYYQVNSILPYEIAKMSKESGVKQFIFLSTMGVYGQEKQLPYGNVITGDMQLKPRNFYGKSKFIAEQKLQELIDDNFTLAIVRPPNIYGKDCPGNYLKTLKKVAMTLPVFPNVYTSCYQSFLYIDNLSELIKLIIDGGYGGIFLPQDKQQISTPELLEKIASANCKKLHLSKALGQIVRLFSWTTIIKKIYGGVSYDIKLSECFNGTYRIVDSLEGIIKSVTED